jgi:hypothetical protein
MKLDHFFRKSRIKKEAASLFVLFTIMSAIAVAAMLL